MTTTPPQDTTPPQGLDQKAMEAAAAAAGNALSNVKLSPPPAAPAAAAPAAGKPALKAGEKIKPEVLVKQILDSELKAKLLPGDATEEEVKAVREVLMFAIKDQQAKSAEFQKANLELMTVRKELGLPKTKPAQSDPAQPEPALTKDQATKLKKAEEAEATAMKNLMGKLPADMDKTFAESTLRIVTEDTNEQQSEVAFKEKLNKIQLDLSKKSRAWYTPNNIPKMAAKLEAAKGKPDNQAELDAITKEISEFLDTNKATKDLSTEAKQQLLADITGDTKKVLTANDAANPIDPAVGTMADTAVAEVKNAPAMMVREAIGTATTGIPGAATLARSFTRT